jgi:patatin-like phospholipase/acyl hydrolase
VRPLGSSWIDPEGCAMAGPFKVLALDGGGIRGIIPALVLADIERRTGRRIAELFDLVVGTSTGGILALALAKPARQGASTPAYAASDLVDLYAKNGSRIFKRSLWHEVTSIGGALEEKYDEHGLEAVLREYFTLGHRPVRLSEAVTDVVVTAYEIERRIPWFFKSRRAKSEPGYDFPMAEVARSTSAAPTFFEPERIDRASPSDRPPPFYALVDGGVFANAPAMCAYAEAKAAPYAANDVLVVSLGTGRLVRPIPYDEAKGWGWAQWARPVLASIFDGLEKTVDYQLNEVMPAGRYFRFQIELVVGSDDMDNVTRTNIEALEQRARDLISASELRLAEVAALLSA